ncbi:hypothetical protein BD410DRAFT_403005 [Rickenella mellea]|uniref:Uncharacterized protein n=1 Tax=Rickenella mellea TaxID=50990 RepID=A0A4Y7PXI8_9AGAM|nr:hypothetical protein BD410DRAFT_403005 [Rickenella mellea]
MPTLPSSSAPSVTNEVQRTIPFDSPQYRGPMQTSTKIGLFVGFFCLFSILLGFFLVAKWKRNPKSPTFEDKFNERSLERWMQNISSAKQCHGATVQEKGLGGVQIEDTCMNDLGGNELGYPPLAHVDACQRHLRCK